MDELLKTLNEKHGDRWIGKAEYSCLTCCHSMSTEDNELICVINPSHKKVEETHLCENWS